MSFNFSEPKTSHGLENQDPKDSQLRLVLLGKTGAGKSAAGNSILGRKAFHSSLSLMSVTKVCKKESSTWNGREIVVVDTPGLFVTDVQDADTEKEIANCILLTSPGPHILVLVLPLGRYTKEEDKALERMLMMFGPKARRYMVLLFTRKDDLDGMEFRDYLEEAPASIKNLIKQFGGRHCAFNNKATGPEQEAQRAELLGLVQRVLMENEGGFFTNKMYQMAEMEIQKQIKMIQEQCRAEYERKRRCIKEEYEERIRKLEDKLEQEKERAEKEQELAKSEEDFSFRLQNARNEATDQNIVSIIKDILRIASFVASAVFKTN